MKMLMITAHLPWPLDKYGAAQRSGLLLQALQRWGDVDVLFAEESGYFERPGVRDKMGEAEGYAIHEFPLDLYREVALWRFLSLLARGKLQRLLQELGRCKADFVPERRAAEHLRSIRQEGQYDVLVVRHLRFAMRTMESLSSASRVLLDMDDIDWQVHRTREEQGGLRTTSKKVRDLITGKYLQRTARRCLGNFTHVWAASEEDKCELNLENCSVLPNIPLLPSGDDWERLREVSPRDGILFVGMLGYGPNTTGLDHFLREIWPAVHKAQPTVRLKVVGKLPENSERVDAWKQAPNVDFLGFVDSLDSAYAQALFTIAPVYWGGGTKIKVLESLGRGRTCVATPHALYGVGQHIRHDDSVWCADTDEDFVQGCITLIENPELRKRMEVNGAAVVQKHYSIETFNQAVDDVMCQFQDNAATGKA